MAVGPGTPEQDIQWFKLFLKIRGASELFWMLCREAAAVQY
jgi:hypothetical protein